MTDQSGGNPPSLLDAPYSELRQALVEGRLSEKAFLEAHEARLQAKEAEISAFISLYPEKERALALSKAKEEALPLLGFSVALKDAFVTLGLPTTAGSKMLEHWRAPYEGSLLRRLKGKGAFLLGKTNMDEFGMGSDTGHSAFFQSRNPWDVSRVPGGSSGGSAAAVAAGFVRAALGTDTGGSVRQPASFCGVVGLKPSYGRLSRHGVVAYAGSLDHVGLMARRTEDVALLYGHLAGFDPMDASSLREEAPSWQPTSGDLSGLRIGIPKEYMLGLDKEVEVGILQAQKALKELGASLLPVSMPHTEVALSTYYVLASAEASSNLARFDGVHFGYRTPHPESLEDLYEKTRAEGFGEAVKRRILLGTFVLSASHSAHYYKRALKARSLVRDDFLKAFEEVDLLMGPVAPTVAWKHGQHAASPLSMYQQDALTVPANLSGVPALSLPTAFSPDGLPIGLQFMAPHLQENRLFDVAKTLESHLDLNLIPPMMEAP